MSWRHDRGPGGRPASAAAPDGPAPSDTPPGYQTETNRNGSQGTGLKRTESGYRTRVMLWTETDRDGCKHQTETDRARSQHQTETNRARSQHQTETDRVRSQHQTETDRDGSQHQTETDRDGSQYQAETETRFGRAGAGEFHNLAWHDMGTQSRTVVTFRFVSTRNEYFVSAAIALEVAGFISNFPAVAGVWHDDVSLCRMPTLFSYFLASPQPNRFNQSSLLQQS